MDWRVRVARWSAVALIAVLVPACSAAGASSDLAAGFVGSQDVFDTSANYRSYEARLDAAGQAYEQCMEADGHPEASREDSSFAVQQIGRVGAQDAMRNADTSDADFAAAWGFGITTMQDFTPAAPDLPAPDLPQDSGRSGESDSQPEHIEHEVQAAARATCEATAAVNVGDGNAKYGKKVSAIRAAKDEFAAAVATVAHYARWSACMTRTGFDHPSPIAAHREIERQMIEALGRGETRWVDTDLRALEIELASATAACGGPVRDLLIPELESTWVQIALNHGL